MIQSAADLMRRAVARVRAWWAAPRADLGASALEWAIIAGIVVVAASVIGGVVYNIVEEKGAQLEKCANQPVGSACSK